MDFTTIGLSFVAAVAAGIVNALAGGGTLITFPLLMMLGLPAVSANITNTIALTPGYLGGTWAQREEIKRQGKKLWLLIPLGAAGGIGGGLLLLRTGERAFREIIPYLILFATLLIAIQPVAKNLIAKRESGKNRYSWLSVVFLLLPASIYGGYFGAGVSIIILAALGLIYNDSVNRLNALKQLMSFCINASTAIFFLFSKQVNWPVAAVMAAGAVAGGYLGGRWAGKLKPSALRVIIIVIGLAVSIYYFLK
jgi:uncharacterized protein